MRMYLDREDKLEQTIDRLRDENAALRKERDMWKSCAERTDAKMLHEQSDHNKTVERLIVVKAENAALREAVLFIPKMRWQEDAFYRFSYLDAFDEKAAANVIVRRAIEIAGKEEQP